MNEYSILFHLLTQRSNDPKESDYLILGSDEEQLFNRLKFSGKVKNIRLYDLLNEFSRNISPFGLSLQKNPFNNHWFIRESTEIQELFQSNPFGDKHRLSATLCVILSLSLTQSDTVAIEQIKKIRKKKDISNDLEELNAMKFINIDNGKVSIHPNLGYYINIDQFIDLIERNAKIRNNTSEKEV